ncbi:UrcA family protein [Qipengyuania sp. 902]|uniref:UrcA family protein n=1 Tax=Qipengyuania sp. 902 TaxID=3417565 RepID=UPI003EBDE7A9
MKKTVLIAATLAILPAQVIASDIPSIAVETTDLDLASAKDQNRLESRVERAIRKACADGGKGLTVMAAEKQCRAELREAANVEIRLAIAAARGDRFAALDVDSDA